MSKKKTVQKTSKKKVTKRLRAVDSTRSKSPFRKATRKGGPRTAEELQMDMEYRKETNRRVRNDELRNMFKTKEYIRQLEIIDGDVAKLFKEIVKRKHMSEDEARALHAKVTLLREKKDLQFKRIAKVLGDVKSVELTDGDGKNPLDGFVEVFKQAMGQAS